MNTEAFELTPEVQQFPDIYHARAAFLAKFEGVEKTGYNTFTDSNYFTLDDINGATKPGLEKVGLHIAHVITVEVIDTILRSCLVTELRMNETGEIIASVCPLPNNENPQVYGSSITYYKKYNIGCLLNISEQDDDGNIGANYVAAAAAKAARQPQKPATKEQMASLKDHADSLRDMPSSKRVVAQLDYYQEHLDDMTEADAREILNRIKESNS